MHINHLSVERYKPFYDRCRIEFRPLTILVGANNSGKSALARALPLFAGGLQVERSLKGESPLPLSSFGLVHGDSFEDLIAGRFVHGEVKMGARFTRGDQTVSLDVAIQNVVSPGHVTMQVVSTWKLSLSDGRAVQLAPSTLDSDSYDIIVISADGGTISDTGVITWQGIVPSSTGLNTVVGEDQWHVEILDDLSDWSQGIRYLRSPRELVESPFKTPTAATSSTGGSGKETPLLLAGNSDLLGSVKKWFLDTFDVRLDVRPQGDVSLLEVDGTAISQAGQGLSQVLPVAAQCMTAQDVGTGVAVLEHPEAELHPGVHGDVADLIVKSLQGADRPVIVETHSEVLLLRIRRHVADGTLSSNDVAVYWVDGGGGSNRASVRQIEITDDGEVTDWPEGVFQEDYEEVVAIRRAARDRTGQ